MLDVKVLTEIRDLVKVLAKTQLAAYEKEAEEANRKAVRLREAIGEAERKVARDKVAQ